MSAIFKRDFRALYTSPVGYVFSGTLLLMIYLVFFLVNVSIQKTSDIRPVMQLFLSLLFLPIPILTMRLITDEYRQKTDQLLLTAPVNVSGIVLGKFCAGLASFGVTIVGSLLMPVVIALFGSLNGWTVFGNYVALVAAAGSFIAISLFISSLTENPIVSIILNWAVFIALILMDSYSTAISVPFLKSIVSWISPYHRFVSFSIGIFSLSDFIYFISVAAIFLFLTARVLEKKRYS